MRNEDFSARRQRIQEQNSTTRVSEPRRRSRESPATPTGHESDRLPLHPNPALRKVEQEKDEQQRLAFTNQVKEDVHDLLRENSFLTRPEMPTAAATKTFHNHLNAPVFTAAAAPPATINPVRP